MVGPRRDGGDDARDVLLERRCDAIMATGGAEARRAGQRRRGGERYVWIVDEADRICSLAAMAVTGVITDDPRLFDQPRAGPAIA